MWASVEFRRAPEAPYPAMHDDAYDALAYLAGNAKLGAEQGYDPAAVSIAGFSAGAGLACCIAAMAAKEARRLH